MRVWGDTVYGQDMTISGALLVLISIMCFIIAVSIYNNGYHNSTS